MTCYNLNTVYQYCFDKLSIKLLQLGNHTKSQNRACPGTKKEPLKELISIYFKSQLESIDYNS